MATNSTSEVTLPSSLAFLVSNFHSLVNIKLDGGNYLLWKIQVENVLKANGFLGYLTGSMKCPESQIRSTDGVIMTNSAFVLWNLIDSQLLSCLTASLSQNTLPYVLGLDHAYQVWSSLSSRYNSLSRAHVHELRGRMYSVTKTSTMENYIDTIKEYAQKLVAAGSPMEDDDLVFHTLTGLKSKAFDAFKTGVRLRGSDITFDELVTLLNDEDIAMIKDDETETTTVLVTSHGSSSVQSQTSQSNVGNMNIVSHPSNSQAAAVTSTGSVVNSVPLMHSIPMMQSVGSRNQFLPSFPQNQFLSQQQQLVPPQQFYPTFSSRNFPKGRGGRGPRYPRDPCEICGRNNHITSFCYYRPQIQSQFQNFNPYDQFSNSPWRGSQINSWMPSSPIQYNYPILPPQLTSPGSTPFVRGSQASSVVRGSQASPVSFSPAYTGGYMSYPPSVQPSAQAHFTGHVGSSVASSSGHGYSSNSGIGNGYDNRVPPHYSSSQPWYFDSGATNHITNNMQNLEISQPVHGTEGVLVGNGSSLQVTHTGQDFSRNSLPGAMSQGALSTYEQL